MFEVGYKTILATIQKCDLSSFSIECNDKEDNFKVAYLGKIYIVDMIICSGSVGGCEKLCKYAPAVFLSLEHSSTSYNIANRETKALMLFVAEVIKPNAD